MVLIIGGAYMGKREYAEKTYKIPEEEIFTCTEQGGLPDFSARCIDRIQEFTYFCVQNGLDGVDLFRSHRDEWQDSVLIVEDIFCGVVPLGADMRAWREMTGRLAAYLASEAETVVRVFLGLPEVLK